MTDSNNTTDSAASAVNVQALLNENQRLRSIVENPDIILMSSIYTDETVQLAREAPKAFQLLMVLVGMMNDVNAVIISNDLLEKITRQSNSTVKRGIKYLRSEEWLDVAKSGTSNVYIVNSDIFWHETSHGKRAELTSRVVLGWEEQDEITKQRLPGQATRNIPLVRSKPTARTPSSTVQKDLDF